MCFMINLKVRVSLITQIMICKKHQFKRIISTAIVIALTNLNGSIAKAEISERETNIDIDVIEEVEEITVPKWKRLKMLYTLKGHRSPVYGLAFLPQGNILISAGSYNDPTMKFWAMGTGKKVADIRAHATAVSALTVSPDGGTIASGGTGAGLNLWNGFNREYLSTFLMHENNILSLAITPDSSTLISGSLDGIRIWNLKYRRPAYRLAAVGNPSYALAIHPNGHIIASGDNEGTVQLWNIKTGKFISEFYPYEETITGLAFTPDGKRIITSSEGKVIKIWDLASGGLVRELIGHRDSIRTIALSPDGQTLASGGKDGVRIWDLATNDLLVLIPSTNDWIESLAFSPDSNILAVGSFNNEITVWQANSMANQPVATEELNKQ